MKVIQMKVPKVPLYIKRKMHKLAKLSKEATELHNEISEWFCSKGFDEEALRCGNGESLDELIYGYDVTDEFCKRIENGEFDDTVSPFKKML